VIAAACSGAAVAAAAAAAAAPSTKQGRQQGALPLTTPLREQSRSLWQEGTACLLSRVPTIRAIDKVACSIPAGL
jgi:hypothetical protein